MNSVANGVYKPDVSCHLHQTMSERHGCTDQQSEFSLQVRFISGGLVFCLAPGSCRNTGQSDSFNNIDMKFLFYFKRNKFCKSFRILFMLKISMFQSEKSVSVICDLKQASMGLPKSLTERFSSYFTPTLMSLCVLTITTNIYKVVFKRNQEDT